MARTLVSEAGIGFENPVSVTRFIPSVYLEDELFVELARTFDDLLTTTVAGVDCFQAYLDPMLAPADFLDWVAGLVGSGFDGPPLPEPAMRKAIACSVEAYRLRGTAAGLRMTAAAAAGVPLTQVKVTDPGGVAVSQKHRAAVPPAPGGTIRLRVTVPKGTDPVAAAHAVQAAIEPERPVHSPVQVEIAVQK